MGWSDVAAALLLGSACVGCDRPGRPWCEDCVAELSARSVSSLVRDWRRARAFLKAAMGDGDAALA